MASPPDPRSEPIPPLRVIAAARALSPASERLLAEAVREAGRGAAVSVLFSEEGLDLLSGTWPAALEAAGVRMSLCSKSARGRGLDPAAIPPKVLWSSLTNFLSDADPDARLWTVFA